ncbi:type II secretion system (T2SS) protein N [Stakelama pacifica]|uniref:Type II secretion system (T2SS) protein N n=1 Tax=Stakelama pacifica TaxID=517720 RepID=A0A4R6FF79_9SPHN|nr:type II secretion system (T2SS) protein N [Stakelama pacifica]
MPSRTAPDRSGFGSETGVDSSLLPDYDRQAARRRVIVFVSVGVLAYLIAMVATMPASVLIRNRDWRTGISGTIWNGEAGLAGGSVLSWQFAPLRSLTSLGFAIDWHANGADTDIGGRALFRPGRTVLDHVSGSADASLIKAIQPLPFDCAMQMHVEMPRIAIGGGDSEMEGQLATDTGSCVGANGIATPVAPLVLTAEPLGQETRIRLTPMAQRRRELVRATLKEDGALSITMTQAGAAALPFAGVPGGSTIEAGL